MTALKVKIWSLPKLENLTTGKKYCGKEEKLFLRSNFSSFPQYFQYISNFKSPNYIYIYKMWLFELFYPQFCESDMLRYRYLEVFSSPLEFEITRVDCISLFPHQYFHLHLLYLEKLSLSLKYLYLTSVRFLRFSSVLVG